MQTLQNSKSISPYLYSLCTDKNFTCKIDKASCNGYLKDFLVAQDPVPKVQVTDRQGMDRFLLSEQEIIDLGYCPDSPDCVQTNETGEQSGLLGIDCEMIKTTKGIELARVSIVNSKDKVLYDKYVKPSNPVIDYLTQYSGITPEHLQAATKTLQDIQADLLKLINSNAVLCGHSLDNDLHTLKLVHKKLADSSVLYPHPVQGLKYSLKKLALKYLKKNIQSV
jgi:Exonuclease